MEFDVGFRSLGITGLLEYRQTTPAYVDGLSSHGILGNGHPTINADLLVKSVPFPFILLNDCNRDRRANDIIAGRYDCAAQS